MKLTAAKVVMKAVWCTLDLRGGKLHQHIRRHVNPWFWIGSGGIFECKGYLRIYVHDEPPPMLRLIAVACISYSRWVYSQCISPPKSGKG